jgi:hypothetical protein
MLPNGVFRVVLENGEERTLCIGPTKDERITRHGWMKVQEISYLDGQSSLPPMNGTARPA